VRGAVFPDEVTLRLKETPMRGGVVELPAGLGGENHLYMLRAADHARPLINATSSFIPAKTYEVVRLTREGPIDTRLLDLLEEFPASYVVVRNGMIAPERRPDYDAFLSRALSANRLVYIRRFGEADDLYAVAKTEPGARSEQTPPEWGGIRAWDAMLAEDPVHLLGRNVERSLEVYRLHLALWGRTPRMNDFMADLREVGRGVLVGVEGQEGKLEENLSALADAMAARHAGLNDEQYVERLMANAGRARDAAARSRLLEQLRGGRATRGSVLREAAADEDFARGARVRGLVLLHYFGYLRRNPDDPPDGDMRGFDYWLREVESAGGDTSRLAHAFMSSLEFVDRGGKR
jgi:hypothetical protein